MSTSALSRPVVNPGIFAGLLLMALLVFAAYQVRPTYTIQVGAGGDGPVLRGFNTPEKAPAEAGLPYDTFRWSTGSAAIVLQDVGAQDLDVVLSINGSRPAGQRPPAISLSAGERVLLTANPAPGLGLYAVHVPKEALSNGTLILNLSVNGFSPKGDRRELGVILTNIQVAAGTGGGQLVLPPLDILGYLLGSAALIGLLLAMLGWGPGGVGLGTALFSSSACCLLAFDRLWLTAQTWYTAWPGVLMLGALLILLSGGVAGWILRRSGARWTPRAARALLTIMLAAFVVRLAGQLHPGIFVWDLGFHANILHLVERGQLLFTNEPAEFGGVGHATFYPPTPYLFVLPLKWLFGDELLAIRLLMVAAGTLGCLAVYFIAARVLRDNRAGIFAAALYVALPMAVLPYSWGIASNVFGEFFALLALSIAVGAYPSLSPRRPAFYALTGALFVTLLSHPGVLALATLAFVLIALFWAVLRRAPVSGHGAGWTVAAFASAAALAFALYFRHFAGDMLTTMGQIAAQRTAKDVADAAPLRVGGSVADKSLGLTIHTVAGWSDWLFGGLQGFWNEANAYYRVWPLAGALLGFVLPWRAGLRRTKARGLALAALAWSLSVMFFAVVGWAANLYVRYALFALPVIALGSGFLLSRIWLRGRLGATVSVLVMVFFAVQALALWQYRITYGFRFPPHP